LETKADEEARLRAAMDNEPGSISAKLNAHTKSLNALQEVQGDHTRRLTRIEDRLTSIEGDARTLKGDMGTVKAGVHAILDLLNADLGKSDDS
jgi:chromosome segregation ATPase